MKRIKRLLVLLLLIPILFVNVYAEVCKDSNDNWQRGSVTLSTTSINLVKGATTTFKINGTCAAGRVNIISNNTSVATVTPSSEFLDNSSLTITVKAISKGNTTISIILDDMADYADNVISGTKTINVKVSEPQTSSTTTTTTVLPKTTTENKTTPQTPKKEETTTKKEEVKKEMKVTKFNIIGYDINFDLNTFEYTISVSPTVTKLYIVVAGENITVTGDKEIDITNKDEIVVTLKNGEEVKNYTIHLNKVPNEIVKTETKTVEKEVVKENSTYLYTTIILLIISLVLLILLINSKKKTKIDNTITTSQVRPVTPVVPQTPITSEVQSPSSIPPVQTPVQNTPVSPTPVQMPVQNTQVPLTTVQTQTIQNQTSNTL